MTNGPAADTSTRDAEEPKTYFTSDTHFGHRLMALLRGFGPEGATREDITPEHVVAHDEALVAAWNAVVGPDDVVWHLGDLTLKSPREIASLLKRLRGRIRLILGNHDRAHPLHGAKAIAAQRELFDLGVDYVGEAMRTTIRGRSTDRLPVLLSHFPYRGDHTREERFNQWRLRDEGEVLLHGHIHSPEVVGPLWDRQVHVGWDAWQRPVDEEEVRRIIEAQGR